MEVRVLPLFSTSPNATGSLEKLAKLIHVTAPLLQTKVYLFWQNSELRL